MIIIIIIIIIYLQNNLLIILASTIISININIIYLQKCSELRITCEVAT